MGRSVAKSKREREGEWFLKAGSGLGFAGWEGRGGEGKGREEMRVWEGRGGGWVDRVMGGWMDGCGKAEGREGKGREGKGGKSD